MLVKYQWSYSNKAKHICALNPQLAKHLCTWGKAGTVKLKQNFMPKVADCGTHCMFVGYATDHNKDCFKLWYPVTKHENVTWNIIWLCQMFYSLNVPLDNNKINVIISGEEITYDSAIVAEN